MGIESLVLFAVSATFQVLSARNQKRKQDRARKKAEAEADKRRGFFIPVRGEVAPLPLFTENRLLVVLSLTIECLTQSHPLLLLQVMPLNNRKTLVLKVVPTTLVRTLT